MPVYSYQPAEASYSVQQGIRCTPAVLSSMLVYNLYQGIDFPRRLLIQLHQVDSGMHHMYAGLSVLLPSFLMVLQEPFQPSLSMEMLTKVLQYVP